MAVRPNEEYWTMRKGVCLRFPGTWTIVMIGMILLGAGTALGQPGANRIIYTRQPTFRIPFETDGGDRRLQEVQLYVSEDQGQTWQKKDAVPPERHGFNFRADHDGLYGFAVRTVDYAGRANPTTVQGIRPQLEVYVDTQLPVVMLRPAPAREGMVSVEWDIREDHLDLSSFVLEYHVPGGGEWIPLSVEPVASGQRSWSPSVSGPVDVRLRVRDLAKNEGEMTIRVTPGMAGARGSNAAPEQDPGGFASRTLPGKRWVNSKRIGLNYEIKDEGPSGVQAVELWFTRDGKTWQKYSEDTGRKPPYTFEASDEGLYGFSLIVRSGVGLREREPRNGDAPQVWVEVDLTKPIVHWAKADVGRGSDSGWLTITWKATDRNFGREPITLSYAKELPGPWTQIATNVENTGQYRWQIPAGVPYRFFVRVEATDLAGNVGVLDTAEPAIVDLHQPKGFILGVEPAANRDATPPSKER